MFPLFGRKIQWPALLPHGELDSLLELVAFPLFGETIQWPALLPHGEIDRLLELVAFFFVWREDSAARNIATQGA